MKRILVPFILIWTSFLPVIRAIELIYHSPNHKMAVSFLFQQITSTFPNTITPQYFDSGPNVTGGIRIASKYSSDFTTALNLAIADCFSTAFVGNGCVIDATDFQGNQTLSQNITISKNGVDIKLPCGFIVEQEFGFYAISGTFSGTLEGCTSYGSALGSSLSANSTTLYTNSTNSTGGSYAIKLGDNSALTKAWTIKNLAINTTNDSGMSAPPTPVLNCSNSGGSLATNTVFVKIWFNTPASGVANTSGNSTVSAQASCAVTGPSGSVVVTAPTLPNGASGYSVGSSSTTNTEQIQVANGACVNITTNCTITVLAAGGAIPTVNTASTMPIYAFGNYGLLVSHVNITCKTATANVGSVAVTLDAGSQQASFNKIEDLTTSGCLVGVRDTGISGFAAANTLINLGIIGPGKTIAGSIGLDLVKGDVDTLGIDAESNNIAVNISGNENQVHVRCEPSTTTTCIQYNSGAGGNIVTAANTAVLVDNSGNTTNITILSRNSILAPSFKGATFTSATNCAVNSASPAACGAAPSGAFVIPTTTTSYTVNTTAVTAASRVILTPRTYAGDLPSAPTCVVPAITAEPVVSALSAGTSFTVTLASTTGQTCWNYWIIN